MTITHINNALFNYFRTENDVFDLEENITEIVPCSIDPELDKHIVIASLQLFEQNDFVRRLPHKGNTVWVLSRPFEDYTQTVEISAVTAAALASIVNKAHAALPEELKLVDPLNITDADLRAALILARAAVASE